MVPPLSTLTIRDLLCPPRQTCRWGEVVKKNVKDIWATSSYTGLEMFVWPKTRGKGPTLVYAQTPLISGIIEPCEGGITWYYIRGGITFETC